MALQCHLVGERRDKGALEQTALGSSQLVLIIGSKHYYI